VDHKQETIRKIREVHNFDIPDIRLEHLYHVYSTELYAASWITPTNRGIEHFCKWANTTPLEEVLGLPDWYFE
jgi:hypothetical protein